MESDSSQPSRAWPQKLAPNSKNDRSLIVGKKKALKKAIRDAKNDHSDQIFTPLSHFEDKDKLVQISIFVTSGDRYRLKSLGLHLNKISMQRLGHRAWNALLISHGQPELTPVSQGIRSKGRGD